MKNFFSAFKKKHPWAFKMELKGLKFIHIGSDYGGWTIIDNDNLNNSTIISAGLGEDASFDIEMAERYKANIIVVDPTPRAILHYNAIISRIGMSGTRNYLKGGLQPVELYNLKHVDVSQFHLVPKALWNQCSELKFYTPSNPNHCSHSISNVTQDYRVDTPYIVVESITPNAMLNDLEVCVDDISLIKLDIEGAEIEVIHGLMDSEIFPSQILIEFDDLINPSSYACERVSVAMQLLKNNDYVMAHSDGKRNFLFCRMSLLNEISR